MKESIRKARLSLLNRPKSTNVAGNEMKLDGKARFAGPVAVDFINGGTSANLLFSLIIIWEVRKSEDTLA